LSPTIGPFTGEHCNERPQRVETVAGWPLPIERRVFAYHPRAK
jgi:hypothetical protein